MRGSCLCGDVVWEGSGPGDLVHHCHCSMCRKSHGTPFATAGGFAEKDFRFVSGEGGIRRRESSPGFFRCFCGRCGSVVPGPASDGIVFVPFGNVEDDPGGRPVAHIFVASKAPWYDLPEDGLPRFDAYPPGYAEPKPLPSPPRSVSEGRVGGSCLCGAVAFDFEPPIDRWYQCHCSRCRRARRPARVEHFSRRQALPLAARRGPDRRLQAARGRALHAELLPDLRLEGAARQPAGRLRRDPGRQPRRRSRRAGAVPHLRRVEGAVVRDRRRAAAARRAAGVGSRRRRAVA